jgi:hypothetical protein
MAEGILIFLCNIKNYRKLSDDDEKEFSSSPNAMRNDEMTYINKKFFFF